MSHNSKHTKNQATAKPHKESPEKENCNRHVFVEPGTKIDLVDDLKDHYKTANEQSTTQNRKNLFWARITTVFTICYVGLTALIYWSSKRSADAAVSVASTAAETFRADQRAWVGIQGMGLKLPADPKQAITAQAAMVNFGKTFAIDVIPDYSLLFSHGERDIAQYVKNRYATGVKVNEPRTQASVGELVPSIPHALNVIHEEPQAPLSVLKQQRLLALQQVNDGQLLIYLFGRVNYKDVFGVTHHTDFCGIWNPKVGGFDACPSYNDAD